MNNRRIKKAYNIFKEEGMRSLLYRSRLALAEIIAPKYLNPNLISRDTNEELDRIARQCKDILKIRPKKQYERTIYEMLKQHSPWYQRIDLPKYNLCTVEKDEWAVFDGAGDNTLGGRLLPKEAAVLRPQPKWMFIKNRLPQIKDKTMLEVGSNCGFFSFEFAKMGAKEVVGIEAIKEYIGQAGLLKDLSGFNNVNFINKDFLFSQPLTKYDIIFSSSALGHFIFPFLGLYKMLECAREFVILDIDVLPSIGTPSDAICHLYVYNQNKYHFFNFSHIIITKFLNRLGIDDERITKHLYADRCLYIIDVTSIEPMALLGADNDPLWSSIK